MTKLRKQRRKKKYRYNVNRKRLRNKIFSDGKMTCKDIKNAWEKTKSVRTNLENMGLSYDPNKSVKAAVEFRESLTVNTGEWKEEALEEKSIPSKAYVAQMLEKEAKTPRERKFRLPNSQVEWITYLMDKYGTNYKMMVRDKRNYYQETWKQLRAKIKTFKGVPEQYSKYLEGRGLTGSGTMNENFDSESSD